MKYTVAFVSGTAFDFNSFVHELDVSLELLHSDEHEQSSSYYFFRPGISVTCFELLADSEGQFQLSVDGLASYDDYRFFPYLADSLHVYLTGERLYVEMGRAVYEQYNEDWIENSIGNEIALVKTVLSVAPRYYPVLPITSCCITLAQLEQYAVNLQSSTSRIYGYLQYLMHHGRLQEASWEQMLEDSRNFGDEMEADVPQHESIGRVKSWQTDGSETWESFSRKDVEQLLALGRLYTDVDDTLVDAVVLNDLGTVYMEGIGVEKDGRMAAYWFREAIRKGDYVFAAANLGDLYRKGSDNLPASLSKAFEAYLWGTEPYTHYRLGQAYEEGWIGEPDMERAMKWYHQAAGEGHHLAIKRLSDNQI